MTFPKPIVFIGALGIVALMAMGFWISDEDAQLAPAPMGDMRTIRVGDTPVRVTIADSFDERAQGLSGRAGLESDEGLWFVFEEDGRHAFWMKDMLFSIDIIWVSSAGEVVHVEKSVSPETYPKPFTPDSPARYVLEVPAGFAEQHAIGIGSKIQLP